MGLEKRLDVGGTTTVRRNEYLGTKLAYVGGQTTLRKNGNVRDVGVLTTLRKYVQKHIVAVLASFQ